MSEIKKLEPGLYTVDGKLVYVISRDTAVDNIETIKSRKEAVEEMTGLTLILLTDRI